MTVELARWGRVKWIGQKVSFKTGQCPKYRSGVVTFDDPALKCSPVHLESIFPATHLSNFGLPLFPPSLSPAGTEDIDLELQFTAGSASSPPPSSTNSLLYTKPGTKTSVAKQLSSLATVAAVQNSTLAALLNNPCLPPTPPSSQCGSDSETVR